MADQRRRVVDSWNVLPAGARVALDQQWTGLAAGGLPCGSAILNAEESILAVGRNHAYDPPGGIETRAHSPLQHTRLAHAELNAMALLATEADHGSLTLWSTQHPCAMCAAAVRFVGIGKVRFVADDPSDDSPAGVIVATRGGVPYEALGDPLWWTISNLLFLYNSALQKGADARNLRMNRARYPELVRLTLDLAKQDALGHSSRSGTRLLLALAPHADLIVRASQFAP
jgi:tRNA(Arg) A34 adenosine deaminase TadA